MIVQKIHISKVRPHPGNVRKGPHDPVKLTELANSIQARGILQPLIAKPAPGGTFQLVTGHRRLEAARLLGLDHLPIVLWSGTGGAADLELMLIENTQRLNLNPMDEAEALGRLRDAGFKVPEIAKRTGMAKSTIEYRLALLDLDDTTRQRVREGNLPTTQAVTAVQSVRRNRRHANGSKATFRWEPDHLGDNHPLAASAKLVCDLAGHTMRRRVSKTACGQCWEQTIREDERTKTA